MLNEEFKINKKLIEKIEKTLPSPRKQKTSKSLQKY